MTEGWLRSTVHDFWLAAGESEAFPRNLETAVLWALPVVVVKLPKLWIRDVEAWLEDRQIPFRLRISDRPLHACLIAHSGNGAVLLNGTDHASEQRFSLSHEIAHLIVDYLWPRERAIEKLGARIVEVLDGERPATVEERVHGVLSGVPVGVHTHLMERRDGLVGCSQSASAEGRADRLALELLAPATEARRRLEARLPDGFDDRARLLDYLLIADFGLPDGVAKRYAESLCSAWYGGPSVREWLGV